MEMEMENWRYDEVDGVDWIALLSEHVVERQHLSLERHWQLFAVLGRPVMKLRVLSDETRLLLELAANHVLHTVKTSWRSLKFKKIAINLEIEINLVKFSKLQQTFDHVEYLFQKYSTFINLDVKSNKE